MAIDETRSGRSSRTTLDLGDGQNIFASPQITNVVHTDVTETRNRASREVVPPDYPGPAQREPSAGPAPTPNAVGTPPDTQPVGGVISPSPIPSTAVGGGTVSNALSTFNPSGKIGNLSTGKFLLIAVVAVLLHYNRHKGWALAVGALDVYLAFVAPKATSN